VIDSTPNREACSVRSTSAYGTKREFGQGHFYAGNPTHCRPPSLSVGLPPDGRPDSEGSRTSIVDPMPTFMMLDAKPIPSNQLPSTTGSFSAARLCCHGSPLALKSAATSRSRLDDPGWDSTPGPVRASIGFSEWAIDPIVDSVYRTEAWNSGRRPCVGGRRGDWH